MVLRKEKDDIKLMKYKKIDEIISHKKVILYYINMECQFQYSENTFTKIKKIFTCIENSRDFVLVWLQPFSEEVASTYHNNQKLPCDSNYEPLIAYAKDCRHIFCASKPDWDFWLQAADVYYGNYHNCILDFAIQGKPVMIQDNIKENAVDFNEKEGEAIGGGIICHDFMYYSSGYNNALLKSNLFNGDTEYLGEFPTERDYGHLYGKAVRYKNTIIFAPLKANSIALYDIKTKKFHAVQLPKVRYPYDENQKYSDLFCYHNFIYFVPNKIPVFLELDMTTYKLTSFISWYEAYKPLIQFPYDNLFLNGGCQVESSYFLPSAQNDMVLEFDLQDKTFIHHRLGDTHHFYLTISFDGRYFWLTGDKRSLTRWNKSTKEKKEFSYPKEYVPCSNPFFSSQLLEQKLLLIPNRASMFLEVDISDQDNCKFKVYPISPDFKGKKYNFCELYHNRLAIQERESKKFYIYDITKKRLSKCYLGYSHKTLENLWGITNHIRKELKEFEKEQYTFYNLLKFIKDYKNIISSNNEIKHVYGKYIHKTILKSI